MHLPHVQQARLWRAARILALVLAASASGKDDWTAAAPGWPFEFPADHLPHPAFKTEWWYFTGNLTDERGRRFGYQATFFRQGLRPLGSRAGTSSDLLVNDFPFAHFSVSDPDGKRFVFEQKVSRGIFGDAGFYRSDFLAWIDDWALRMDGDRFRINAANGGTSVSLAMSSAKPWTVHGVDGVSQKAAGAGHASHYYSGTRMTTSGTMTMDGKPFAVTGLSWFDHEWATNQLTDDQAGWDWFGIQLSDGADLMLYAMRLRGGGTSPESSGTIAGQGSESAHLARKDYRLTPTEYWTSKKTGARYPVAWRIEAPGSGIDLKVSTPLKNQELALGTITYWEGAIDVEGTHGGVAVTGRGYMELTGYAGPLSALSGASR